MIRELMYAEIGHVQQCFHFAGERCRAALPGVLTQAWTAVRARSSTAVPPAPSPARAGVASASGALLAARISLKSRRIQ
jgi:hypothetical protein